MCLDPKTNNCVLLSAHHFLRMQHNTPPDLQSPHTREFRTVPRYVQVKYSFWKYKVTHVLISSLCRKDNQQFTALVYIACKRTNRLIKQKQFPEVAKHDTDSSRSVSPISTDRTHTLELCYVQTEESNRVQRWFTSTETLRTIRDGESRTSTSTFT